MITKIRAEFEWMFFQARLGQKREKFYRNLAWLLPRELVLWCFVRVLAHATMGEWGNTEPSTVTGFEAMDRWKKPNI